MSKKRTRQETWNISAYPKKDRPVILKEMTRLLKKHGREGLSASVLLQETKKKRNPLHKYYTWDDASAGEQHRLWQARKMLAYVVAHVQFITPTGRVSSEYTTRALISDTKRGQRTEGHYHTLAVVMGDDALRANYLERALAELNAVRMRYSELVELAGVYREIDKLAKKVAAA
ncbi:hypothetical protein LCGC14_1232060 [marine sediment metagenome]|uniref:Uncharacterized protein n=1 Tax=marine sediment metagenome TaxID=412755 RepID=A0A0F9LC92_9ZZZZ